MLKTGNKTASKPNGSRASVKRVSKQDVKTKCFPKLVRKLHLKLVRRKKNKADDGVQNYVLEKRLRNRIKKNTTADQNRKKESVK